MRFEAMMAMVAASTILAISGPARAGGVQGVVRLENAGGAEGIVVYLVHAPPIPLDLAKASFVMVTRELAFVPRVLPVPVGSRVEFKNEDMVNHNVFSLSQTKKFNLGVKSPGQGTSLVFEKPGIVELSCDVHQQMKAFLLVMKTPYFALTDKQGRFTIPDPDYLALHGMTSPPQIPEGKYLVRTWHESLKSVTSEVTVADDPVSEIVLTPTKGPPGNLYDE